MADKKKKVFEKKRLLIVNDLLQGGGVEKLMHDLVWHWHRKYDITIMTWDYCQGFEEQFPKDTAYLWAFLPEKKWKSTGGRLCWKVCRKLYKEWFRKRFSGMDFDVVISMKDGWVMREAARMNIPVKYAWIHTDYRSYYYTRAFYGSPDEERECMQQFRKIVCVSEEIKQGILTVIGDPGNLLVKYNPIRVRSIREKSLEPVVDADEQIPSGVTRFVTVGRLNYQKGYDLLLEACHMLERDGLQFEVWVIGGEEPWGDEHERLYRARKRLHVESVRFMGARKNPYKYMRCADWFLSSSLFEGYSLVSQEAAVLDLPLLLTRCSGVRELIGEDEYGIGMEISVEGIYQGMKRVIEHPELQPYYKQKIMERKTIINFKNRILEIEQMLDEETD